MFQRFFKKNRKVEIFSRHCTFSTVSAHKDRFHRLSREKCYSNLIHSVDLEKVNLTFFFDVAQGADHFLPEEKRVEVHERTEAGAFSRGIEYAVDQNDHPETILYKDNETFLELKNRWLS